MRLGGIITQKGGSMERISMKAARVAAGYTQETLARRLGVTRATVASFERGDRKPKPQYILAFCMVTGFSEQELLCPKI